MARHRHRRLSHVAVIEADTAEQGEAEARGLWAENSEHEAFWFSDSGIDVVVDEVRAFSGICRAGQVR